MAQAQQGAEWIKECKIGQGGFGQVYLYKNQKTGDKIAVKKCNLSGDVVQTTLDRWRDEVEIMKRIDHDNIVRVLPTPKQLVPRANEPVPLIMEYCEGGDLRKMLVKAPCGMKESALRWLVKNIASGVEHLHNMHVTHRDIKPENIVIQQRGPDEKDVLYKIIDLGYAKELFDSSILYSFVGTMQYLAPELMSKKGYTRTVDFWSFGVVLFECITGLRPFLPTEVPFRWFAAVNKKRPDDICVYYDLHGEVTYSEKLVFPNHLCRTSGAFMEQFLRLMLRWDPDVRGGCPEFRGNSRDKCWSLLDNILNSKLLFIYCIPKNIVLTYPVEDKHTIKDVFKALERELSIPVTELQLYNVNGMPLPYDSKARNYCGEDEQPSLYLFRSYKEETASLVLPKVPDESEKFPPVVEFVIEQRSSSLDDLRDHQMFISQVAFYCEEKAKQFFRIHLATKALWISLTKDLTEYIKYRTTVKSKLSHLYTLVSFCDQGFQTDLNQYELQAQEPTARFQSTRTIESWNVMRAELSAMKGLEEEMSSLNNKYMQVESSVEALKASPYAPTAKAYAGAEIYRLFQQSVTAYREARKKGRDDNRLSTEDSLKFVFQIKTEYEKQAKGIHEILRQMLVKKQELQSIVQQLEQLPEKINQNRQQVQKFQQRRQEDMWRFIKFALTKNSSLVRSSSNPGASPALQTSVFIAKGTMDSLRAVNNYEQIRSKSDSLVGQSGDESNSNSNTDWSFLNSNQPR
ncbi:inhibitor of nuclear factor kappa-B kinase subunit beta-like [Watersipora subatra]|uniref:inhibitor of nuclear factor kappa-B kinase subunit beta-like n=1 Tax=Watersipora subatra TaxID=2589382 RepID=UPI00355B7303